MAGCFDVLHCLYVVIAVKLLEGTNFVPSLQLLHLFFHHLLFELTSQNSVSHHSFYNGLPLLPTLEKGLHVSGNCIDILECLVKLKHFWLIVAEGSSAAFFIILTTLQVRAYAPFKFMFR